MSDDKFCTKCGSKVPASAQFCQECGEVVAGSEAYRQREEDMATFNKTIAESRTMWLRFLLALYGLPALVMGIYIVLDASSIANTAWNNGDILNWLNEHDITYDQLLDYVNYVGYLVIASGALVTISLVLTCLQRFRIIAFTCCLIGSFLCFFSLFGMLIGIMVSWMILSAKDTYKD